MDELVSDVTSFARSIFECYEHLLRVFMDDRLLIYDVPVWQWMLGGAFILGLGSIIASKVFR